MTSTKKFRSGTHRSATPQETLAKILKFLPAFGITRLANLTGLDRVGIPVVAATRPNSKALVVSQGKGATIEAAKVSALMESIEGFHAENIFKPTLNMSLEDLSLRAAVIDVCGLARSFEIEFDPSQKILWLEGWDLINHQKTWVPYDSVSTDFSDTRRTPSLISDSNGLSSGNTMIESLIHGFCEVIERDALSLFFHSIGTYHDRKITPSSIDDTQNHKFLSLFTAAQIDFGIWDITTDIGVPTYICMTLDSDQNKITNARPTYGSGTHLNKNVALSRAITEAAQSRATFISGARDDQNRSKYISSYSQQAAETWKTRLSAEATLDFRALKNLDHESFEEDLDVLITSLTRSGMKQAIYIDLTKEEFGIPVSRVLVPHLEGITNSHDRATGTRISMAAQ